MPTRRSSNPTFRTTGNDPYGAIGTGLANLMTAMVPDPKVAAYTQLAEQRGNLIDQQIKTSASTAAFNKAKTAASTFGLNNRQKLAEMLSNVVNKSRVPLGADGRIDETSIAYQSAMEQARRLQAQNFLINGGKNGTGANSAIAGIFANNPDIARAMAYANNGVVNPNTSFSREEQEAIMAQLIAADQQKSDSAATIKGNLANKGSAANTRMKLNNPRTLPGIAAKGITDTADTDGNGKISPEEINAAAIHYAQNPALGGARIKNSELATTPGPHGNPQYVLASNAPGVAAVPSLDQMKAGIAARMQAGDPSVTPDERRLVGVDPVAVASTSRLVSTSPVAGEAPTVLLDSKAKAPTAASSVLASKEIVRKHLSENNNDWSTVDPYHLANSKLKPVTLAGVKQVNASFGKALEDTRKKAPMVNELVNVSGDMLTLLKSDGADIISVAGGAVRRFQGMKEQAIAFAHFLGATDEEIPSEGDVLTQLTAHAEKSDWGRKAMANAQMRSMVVGLAYSMASAREGGGKLSTSDINFAIETLGGGLASAESFKAVLGMVRGNATKVWNDTLGKYEALYNGQNGVADWKKLVGDSFGRISLKSGQKQLATKPGSQTAQPNQSGAAPAVARWGRDANGKPTRIN